MQCQISFVHVAGGAAELEVERVGEINSRSARILRRDVLPAPIHNRTAQRVDYLFEVTTK